MALREAKLQFDVKPGTFNTSKLTMKLIWELSKQSSIFLWV